MPIVVGSDLCKAQITFDAPNLPTGEIRREASLSRAELMRKVREMVGISREQQEEAFQEGKR